MRSVIVVFLLGFACFAKAQQRCSGLLLDSISRQPVEFANIGVVGLGAGTVSDQKGEFSFYIPDSLLGKTIKVSMIGYKPRQFTTSELASHTVIYLSPVVTTLGEVQVVAGKTKIKILGNDTRSKLISGGFKRNNLGAEIATRIRIKHKETQLRKFFININVNALEAPVFRFNVYRLDAQGWPGENILNQNIIIEPGKKTGLVEVDLARYNIVVSEDIFISLEWIRDLGTTPMGLTFSTKLTGGNTYFRRTSQDKWGRKNGIGVGLYTEVAY